MPMDPNAPMPQGGEQEEMAEGEAPEGGQQGGVTELIAGLEAGLTQLHQMMGQANLPPELVDGMGAVVEQYRQVIQGVLDLKGGGGQAPAGGSASMEQGGNPKAVPVQQ